MTNDASFDNEEKECQYIMAVDILMTAGLLTQKHVLVQSKSNLRMATALEYHYQNNISQFTTLETC